MTTLRLVKASGMTRRRMAWFGGVVLLVLAGPATAQQFGREQDIVDLRLGQRVMVDDGSCPAGQIKEVSGATMAPTGVVRVRKCVPRLGVKKK